MAKTLGQWFAQRDKDDIAFSLHWIDSLARVELLSVQRSYGDIHAIGLVNTDGDIVFPPAGSLVVVIPKEV